MNARRVLALAAAVAAVATIAVSMRDTDRSVRVATESPADSANETITTSSVPTSTEPPPTSPEASTTTAPPTTAAPPSTAPPRATAERAAEETCFDTTSKPVHGTAVVAVAGPNGLREIPVDGGPPYEVPGAAQLVMEAAWSPDHRLVAWLTQHWDLIVTDLVRNCQRTIPSPDGKRRYARDLAWRSDSSRLSFVEDREGSSESSLVIVSPDGTNRREVGAAISGGVWAPDGSNRLAFGDREGLKVVDLDRGRTRLLHPTSGGAEFPQWSPDAGRITFSISLDSAVWIVDADATQGRKLVDKWQVFFTNWSPDGSHIAYLYERGVWIVRADGSDDRRVPLDAEIWMLPRWSPDGETIAVTTGTYQDTNDVVLVGLDGTNPRTIAHGAIARDHFIRP